MAAVPTLSVMEVAESVRVIVWAGGGGRLFCQIYATSHGRDGSSLGIFIYGNPRRMTQVFLNSFFIQYRPLLLDEY